MPAVPLNVEFGLLALPNEPPVPATILHAPVPTVGVLADRVTVVRPQVAASVWSGPALAVVGLRLNVIVTSSVEATQGEFEIVQRKV